MTGSLIAIYFSAALFAVLGVSSIIAPTLTTAQFGIHELDRKEAIITMSLPKFVPS